MTEAEILAILMARRKMYRDRGKVLQAAVVEKVIGEIRRRSPKAQHICEGSGP